MKVSSKTAVAGKDGEIGLAKGKTMAMRLWRNEQPHDKPAHRSTYETLGYVVSGRAELMLDGKTTVLEPGDSWVVPADVEHTYKIIEAFTAVECTSPPASAG